MRWIGCLANVAADPETEPDREVILWQEGFERQPFGLESEASTVRFQDGRLGVRISLASLRI